MRDLSRALELFPYYTGGTVTGRFKGVQPDAERLAMARTRPLRETKVIVESTPLSGVDYSEIEKRIAAHMGGLPKWAESPPEDHPYFPERYTKD